MKLHKTPLQDSLLTMIALVGISAATASAQILHGDFTNSKVSYLDVTENGLSGPLFVPPTPTTSADPNSSISFKPSSFIQTDQNVMFDLKTKQSQLGMTISAAPGQWFTGNALVIETAGSYNLVAPFGSPPMPFTVGGPTNSYAYASSTAVFSLTVTGVDNAAFLPGSPLAASVVITPSSLDLIGPGGSTSGAWTGKVTLDINTIKVHFGIGAINNVTQMQLSYTAQVAAAGVYGQATTSVMDLIVTNQTVPEPSTYALLAMAAGVGAYMIRRRR